MDKKTHEVSAELPNRTEKRKMRPSFTQPDVQFAPQYNFFCSFKLKQTDCFVLIWHLWEDVSITEQCGKIIQIIACQTLTII